MLINDDLIEGNFGSVPNNVSYTDLQRKMKKCVDEDELIIARWLEYAETPTNPYANKHWTSTGREL